MFFAFFLLVKTRSLSLFWVEVGLLDGGLALVEHLIPAAEMVDEHVVEAACASIVPIAFPLIAGPGALTALLSLRADYAVINIIIGLLLNILMDYIVIRSLDKIQKIMGENLIFILRKFFGVILLAIAVNMFVNNILAIIASVPK